MNFDILFPDEREEGETQLQQCQLVMLRMLKIFDYLCTKHDIQYFLTGGSLLGAIRFGGFIPWDDDLDVGMTRDNYDKFVALAVPELPDDIFFQSDKTDPYFPACHVVEARLRDRYSSYSRGREVKNKWHDGLMLELMVYDRAFLPNRYFIFAFNKMLTLFCHNKQDGNNKRAKILSWIDKHVPLPLVYETNLVNNWMQMNKGLYYIKPSEIERRIKVPFGDMEAWIPAGYDAFLRRQYGTDYRNDNSPRQHGVDLPNPTTPCNHTESLQWKDKKTVIPH